MLASERRRRKFWYTKVKISNFTRKIMHFYDDLGCSDDSKLVDGLLYVILIDFGENLHPFSNFEVTLKKNVFFLIYFQNNSFF